MNQWDKEKELYQKTEIPKELRPMVRKAILRDRRRRQIQWTGKIVRIAGSIAAVLFVCLLVGVNANYVFAKNAGKIPVVGSVAKVLTVRKYEEEKAADPEWTEVSKETPPVEETASVSETLELPEIVPTEEILEPPLPVYDESGNEVIPLSDFETWIQEMTVDKLKSLSEKGDDCTEIIASLPESDIFLYGYRENSDNRGTFLRVCDEFQYFGLTYGEGKPELYYEDYDEDGEKEVAVVLYAAKATDSAEQVNSVSDNNPVKKDYIPELWIMKKGIGKYNAFLLSEQDYLGQLERKVGAEYSEKTKELQLYLNDEKMGNPILLADYMQEGLTFDKLEFSSAVKLDMSGKKPVLKVSPVVYRSDGSKFLGDEILPPILADIQWKEDTFNLENIRQS